MTSHYITDINWHGLETVPAGEGLIRSIGYADFNCTNGDLCSIAHTAADTGGEFAAAVALDLAWYPDRWYLPTEDLVQIYSMVGKTVDPAWINECGVLFYVGSFAVAKLGDIVYNLFIGKRVGALLLESYLDFPVGGIDDDAAWTAVMWNRFAEWVTNGPPVDPPNRRLSVAMQDNLRRRRLSQRRFIASLRAVLEKHDIFPLQSGGENLFRISPSAKSGWQIELNFNIEKNSDALKRDEDLLLDISDSLIDEYVVDTFVSAKKADFEEITLLRNEVHRRVRNIFVATDDSEKPVHKSSASANLTVQASGSQPHEYLGGSITVGSFSPSKGNCDVLVGSYGQGVPGSAQRGDARIYFGSACTDIYDDKNSFRFRSPDEINQNVEFPAYERFGWSSAAIDANLDGHIDAVICAPSFGGINVTAVVGNYSGRCDIFFGPFYPNSENASVSIRPQVSVYGDRVWGMFGLALETGDVDSDGFVDLIISAPYAGRLVTYAAILLAYLFMFSSF